MPLKVFTPSATLPRTSPYCVLTTVFIGRPPSKRVARRGATSEDMGGGWRKEWEEPRRHSRSALMAEQDERFPPSSLTFLDLRPAPTRLWSRRDHSRFRSVLSTARGSVLPERR